MLIKFQDKAIAGACTVEFLGTNDHAVVSVRDGGRGVTQGVGVQIPRELLAKLCRGYLAWLDGQEAEADPLPRAGWRLSVIRPGEWVCGGCGLVVPYTDDWRERHEQEMAVDDGEVCSQFAGHRDPEAPRPQREADVEVATGERLTLLGRLYGVDRMITGGVHEVDSGLRSRILEKLTGRKAVDVQLTADGSRARAALDRVADKVVASTRLPAAAAAPRGPHGTGLIAVPIVGPGADVAKLRDAIGEFVRGQVKEGRLVLPDEVDITIGYRAQLRGEIKKIQIKGELFVGDVEPAKPKASHPWTIKAEE